MLLLFLFLEELNVSLAVVSALRKVGPTPPLVAIMNAIKHRFTGKEQPCPGVFLGTLRRLQLAVFLMPDEKVEQVDQHERVTVLFIVQNKSELVEKQTSLCFWLVDLA